MRWKLGLVALMLGYGQLLSAQIPASNTSDAGSVDRPIPPNFRGTITWRGFYQGQGTATTGSSNRVNIGGLRLNIPTTRTAPVSGDYVMTLTFNGGIVTGDLQTGRGPSTHMNGTVSGTVCQLIDQDGDRYSDYCSLKSYRSKVSQTNRQGQHITYEAQAAVTQVVDAVEEERKRAAAEKAAAAAKAEAERKDVQARAEGEAASAALRSGKANLVRLRTRCDQGNPYVCFYLGVAYDSGKGAPKDAALSKAFSKKACDDGSLGGCLNYGIKITGTEEGTAALRVRTH